MTAATTGTDAVRSAKIATFALGTATAIRLTGAVIGLSLTMIAIACCSARSFWAALSVHPRSGNRCLGRLAEHRGGRVAPVRFCLAASLIGLLIFIFSPVLLLAGIGAALWGIGAALGFLG